MTFIEAYAICATIITMIATIRTMKGADTTPSLPSQFASAAMLLCIITGMCSLAANGLVVIVEAAR